MAEGYGAVSVKFANVRKAAIIRAGGKLGRDTLRPSVERSLMRALKTLVDRGDVVILQGSGRPGDPYGYRSVEAIASAVLGRPVTDTQEAKQILADRSSASG